MSTTITGLTEEASPSKDDYLGADIGGLVTKKIKLSKAVFAGMTGFMDVPNYKLLDSGANVSLNWDEHKLYGTDGQWLARWNTAGFLVCSNGIAGDDELLVFDANGKCLRASEGNVSVDIEGRTLNRSNGGTVINYGDTLASKNAGQIGEEMSSYDFYDGSGPGLEGLGGFTNGGTGVYSDCQITLTPGRWVISAGARFLFQSGAQATVLAVWHDGLGSGTTSDIASSGGPPNLGSLAETRILAAQPAGVAVGGEYVNLNTPPNAVVAIEEDTLVTLYVEFQGTGTVGLWNWLHARRVL